MDSMFRVAASCECMYVQSHPFTSVPLGYHAIYICRYKEYPDWIHRPRVMPRAKLQPLTLAPSGYYLKFSYPLPLLYVMM